MAVNVQWYDDAHHVLCVSFSGVWQIQELYRAFETATGYLNRAAAHVVLIMDTTDVIDYPADVEAHLMQMSKVHHPIVKHFVLVAASQQSDHIFTSLRNRAPKLQTTTTIVASFKDALQLANTMM